MSQENVEVVRGLFAALDNQDWEAALGLFDPEVNGLRQKARSTGLRAS